jgi:hypothetical protein
VHPLECHDGAIKGSHADLEPTCDILSVSLILPFIETAQLGSVPAEFLLMN